MAKRVNNIALIGPFFLAFFFFSAFFLLACFFLAFFFFSFFPERFCLTVKGAVGSAGVSSSVVSPFGLLVAGSGIALTAGEGITGVKARSIAKTRRPGVFLSVAMGQPLRPEAQAWMEGRSA